MDHIQAGDLRLLGVRAFARTRVGLYIAVIMLAALGAAYQRARESSIFACGAQGYSQDRYLAYCQSDWYADFDHGALWFSLEPEATRAAAAAQLLFVGSSRLQFGFSNEVARYWLTQNAASYYLLGLAYDANVLIFRELLPRIGPHPKVYDINLDNFFEEKVGAPARKILDEPNAIWSYRGKQLWQLFHRGLCEPLPGLCGNNFSWYRSRQSGAWYPYGELSLSAAKPTSTDLAIDGALVARDVEIGKHFIDDLGVDSHCVIFTLVPTVDTPLANSRAIAQALGVDFIAPQLDGLNTFDGNHLDRASAERWAAAFFAAAGQRLRECLAGPSDARAPS
jgi:hypothetical protein